MENPLKLLGEAFSAGLEKLHRRTDSVEAEAIKLKDEVSAEFDTVKSEVAEFKDEMQSFTAEVEGNVSGLTERLAKLEAMFAPEAVAAVTDKVSSAGSVSVSPSAEPAPAAPAEPAEPLPASEPVETAPAVEEAPAAPVVAMTPSGATAVTVPADGEMHQHEDTGVITLPGTTTVTDAAGSVTTLDHASGSVTAADSVRQPAEVSQAAAAEVHNAAVSAGVEVAAGA